MPGGHAEIEKLRVSADQMLGASGDGFEYARNRLSPARLSHCMRWLGLAIRANEIATDYACRRHPFESHLVDHEGDDFMLAKNLTDLKQSELMVDWFSGGLARDPRFDGQNGGVGSADAGRRSLRAGDGRLRRLDGSDRREAFRTFRIYDAPTEGHKWPLAKKIKKDWKPNNIE